MTEPTVNLPRDPPDSERLVHELRNHLSVIIGFCDVLLAELPNGDPKRADVGEIHRAAHAALAVLPAVSERMR